MDIAKILELLQALHTAGVRYVVVGGVALNFHGLARATTDIDLFVAPDEQNIVTLRQALQTVFHDPEIEQIQATDLLGEYPAIQYAPPSGDFHIDILARLGDAFVFDDIQFEEIIVEGVRVNVATARMLYEMKKDTIRPQDRADADRLCRRFKLGGA